jgi:1-acyl-sn-glycerol-3-phosphate acyltransferase
MSMTRVLRSGLFALLFVGGTLPLVILLVLAAPFSSRFVQKGSWAWAAWFVWCARVFAGVRLVVRGVVPDSACLVALKHQSAFETYLTLYLFEHPAVVMKAELRRIPLWGLVAERHGSIFVDRDRGTASMKRLIREGRARAADGRPILIFPEGTRVPVGEAPPLKSGLSALYSMMNLPVVPVALDSGRVWHKGFLKSPGVVTLAFGPDIPARLDKVAMEAAVHAAINLDPRTAPVRDSQGRAVAA